MRFLHPDGSTIHLAYCTNVHAAQDMPGIIDQLDRYAVPVRQRLGVSSIGLGLWLAAPVARALIDDLSRADELRSELSRRGLEVVTLNGFPYKDFQQEVVKHEVYFPTWEEEARLDYTFALARILQRLLPEDAESGSVSTLPIAWRIPLPKRAARDNLERLAEGLDRMAGRYGKPVRVAVEPEPGCVIETTEQAVEQLSGVAPEWIGICLDACHLAVQFEEPEVAIQRLSKARLPVVKSQVSSALRVEAVEDSAWLSDYVEPRFLHQTRTRLDSDVLGADDLDIALNGALPRDEEWRVHFHVPVHASDNTTQQQLEETLKALVGGPNAITKHLEVETYTWSVLPPSERPADDAGLVDGLASELQWTSQQLKALGLKEIS